MRQNLATLKTDLAQVQQASRQDYLTKLYNRRAVDEFINLKEAEYSRDGRTYSIAMMDLDLFKTVNDTYGHEAGNSVLIEISQILRQESRSNDMIGRYGGEEFIAILSYTELQAAKTFSERVRSHVQNKNFTYQGAIIKVSVSIGVAERKDFLTPNSLINGADQRLYAAKKKGRNRVEPA